MKYNGSKLVLKLKFILFFAYPQHNLCFKAETRRNINDSLGQILNANREPLGNSTGKAIYHVQKILNALNDRRCFELVTFSKSLSAVCILICSLKETLKNRTLTVLISAKVNEAAAARSRLIYNSSIV
jgi:hypothetical protein